MEHTQKEFIIEQLRSSDKMFESPKSSELLSLDHGITTFDLPKTQDLLKKEPSIMSTSNEVVIKSYNSNLYYQSLREYLMGIKVINPLRKITPCFVQTLGGLTHKPDETCIIYEKIKGNTLATMLQEGLSFHSWLRLFIQILLSLELAQRNTGFTHYDLHADNIVVQIQYTDDYAITLDDKSYNITNPSAIPVIIDLGTSSALTDGRFIGSYDYVNSGIFPFIVSGHDMYKLMISSYCHAKTSNTRKSILKLFDFFGAADPYKISEEKGYSGIIQAQKEFCKEVIFSDIASHTPLMLVNYIYNNFWETLSPTINIVPRRILASLLPLNGTEDYNKVILTSQNLVDAHSGYMTAYYILYIVRHSTCQDNQRSIESILHKLDQDKSRRITNDLTMLEEVFKIKHPIQEELDEAIAALLDTPIRHRNASVKECRFDCLEDLLEYQDNISPFLDMYFTILELDLVHEYKDWVERFSASSIYTFYFRNKISNDRARRWGETLLSTIISSN